MPALSQPILCSKLRMALPRGSSFHTDDVVRPSVLDIPVDSGGSPSSWRVRIYLWTVTPVQSDDRPQDEFKIQLILPGQQSGSRGVLDTSGGIPTFLLGYSPEYGVFVGWETRFFHSFAYSVAVNVKEALLDEARNTGWAVAPPRTIQGSSEVRMAFTANNLSNYLFLTAEADGRSLLGFAREAFFLSQTPNNSTQLRPLDLKRNPNQVIDAMRNRIMVSRLERDYRFAPLIKKQFNHACAVCSTSLEIVEGAHIIPVNATGSKDEIWNGIALCANHHKLYDARRFSIGSDLQIRVDHDALNFLNECGKGHGAEEMLLHFDNRTMREPIFFKNNSALRRQMLYALSYREDMSQA